MVHTFILYTKYDENLKQTILSLKENKFNRIDLVKGIIRKTDTSKIVMDSWKINWVFYQKRMKDGDEKYTVGAQGIYIPKELIKPFIDNLLESPSSHFDRWVSRLDNIYYPRGSLNWGEEIDHKSKLHHDNLR